MATYHELLPPSKSSPVASLRWTPSATGRGGCLVITQGKRVWGEYYVVEIEADGGRGFRLLKVTPGSDPETAAYETFVPSESGYFSECSCKGFARHGHCKHAESIRVIHDRGWFSDQLDYTPGNPFPPGSQDHADFEAGRSEARGESEECPF